MKKAFTRWVLGTVFMVGLLCSAQEDGILYREDFEKENSLKFNLFHFDWWDSFQRRVAVHSLETVPAPMLTGYDLGKKSFKIDLTIKDNGKCLHLYLKPDRDIKLEPPMLQTGYLRVERSSGHQIRLGGYVTFGESFVPGVRGGVGKWQKHHFVAASESELPNGWKYTSADLYRSTRGYTAGNPKADLNNAWYGGAVIMIAGNLKKGDRVTLYVDDITLQRSAMDRNMLDPANAEKYYLLGERARYQVRNRLYFRDIRGNPVRNAGFELGLEGWTTRYLPYPADTKVNCFVQELPDAPQGGRVLTLEHTDFVSGTILGDLIHRRPDNRYPVTFLARAEGEMSVNEQRISSEWKLYETRIQDLASEAIIGPPRKWKDHRFVSFRVKGKGKLYLDAISADPQRKEGDYSTLPLPEVAVSFQQGRAYCNMFFDGEKIPMEFSVWNGMPRPGAFVLEYTVRDFYGAVIGSGVFREEVKGGAGFRKTVSLPSGKRGIYYVRALLKTPFGEYDTENSCGIVQRLDSRTLSPDSIFGLSKGCYEERKFNLAARIGARGLNVDAVMEAVQKENLKNDWREKVARNPVPGRTHRRIIGYGMDPLYLTRGIPMWLRPGFPYNYPKQLMTQEKMKVYEEIHTEMAKALGSRENAAFDVWPESCPDEAHIIAMKPWIAAASRGIKAGMPNARVLGCGFWDVSMMGRQVEWAAKHGYFSEGLLDGVTIHPYAANPDISNLDFGLKHIRRILDSQRPGMPIIAAEVGYQNAATYYSDVEADERQGFNSVYSEERTADYLCRMLLICQANRVNRVLMFPALHSGFQAQRFYFGYVNFDAQSPRAALPAMSGLTANIHDAKPIRQFRLGSQIAGAVFQRDRGDALMALWSFSDNLFMRNRVTVERIPGVRFIDLMNNEFTPEATGTRQSFLLSGGTPVLVAADRVGVLEEILKTAAVLPLFVESKWIVTDSIASLALHNPMSSDVDVEVLFGRGSENWPESEQKRAFRLPAGQSVAHQLPLFAVGSEGDLEAEVRFLNHRSILKLRPFLCPRLNIPMNGKRLSSLPGVRGMELNEIRWYGNTVKPYRVTPEDLSGKFFCAWDDAGLHLAFSVRDSVKHQPHSGELVWRGDSIQLAFDPLCNGERDGRSYMYDDFELGLALAAGKTTLVRYFGDTKILDGLNPLVVPEKDGYYYQLSIPWRNLGLSRPQVNQKIGFNFTINDNDGAKMDKFLGLSEGIAEARGKSPFFFRDLILTDRQR